MRISRKLIAGYIFVAFSVGLVGFFGLNASRQIVSSFEGGEEHFRSIVIEATEASSSVKRAESHLMLYLTLGEEAEKLKFREPYKSLFENVSFLEKKVKKPEARKFLADLRRGSVEMLRAAEALIMARERDVEASGRFEPARHRELFRSLNNAASLARQRGIDLANFETDFLNKQAAITAASEVSSYANRAEGHLMLYLALGEEIDRRKFLDRHRSLMEQIRLLEGRVRMPESRIVLNDIRKGARELLATGQALIEAYEKDILERGRFEPGEHADLIRAMNARASSVREQGIMLAGMKIDVGAQAKREAINRAGGIQRNIIIVVAATVLLTLVFGYTLSRSITRPIRSLMEAASLIARGKLDARIEAGSRDEIGELAGSFRKMAADLQKNMVSRRYMDCIINSMVDGVMVVDTGACIRTVNPSLCSMLGYNGAELLGSHLGMILPEGPSFFLEVFQKGSIENVEKALRRKDGDEVPVLMSAAVMQEDGEVKGIVCAALNISERKRLEEQILNSRKLESIGMLASGIAHDFNNFLTAVIGNLNMAKLSLGPEDEALKRLLAAERATVSARHLSQQLLTFTRGGAPVKEVADISALVRETAQFTLSGSTVKCDINSENHLWPVHADQRQLSQVVHNIILNAEGAMPEGGIIRIRCANTTLETGELPPLKGGRYVRVSFEDNGPGIPDENLSRIFDPYFTTKPKGIGLGLAISYSIVRRHGGHLAVESEVGRGSIFHVYLLAAEEEVTPESVGETEELGGSGRVLIMDDEEMVRDSTGEILKILGYDVELACDGNEALERYGRAMEAGRCFDAVIMDLTIPGGMGGREAIQRLRALDPGVRAIVSSGYSTDPVMAEFEMHGFRAYVAKPYKMEELGLALKRVMGEGRASSEG